jgi:hypothetical protein
MACVLIGKTMGKLFGFILLIAGGVMLYFGWQSHLGSVDSTGAVSAPAESESIWLLTIGAVAVVWGLSVSLRRRV